VSTISIGLAGGWPDALFYSLFKGAHMDICQSRVLKLIFSCFLTLSALWGAGSAMAYSGSWASVAIEGGSFSYSPGDFIRYGVTDIPDCGDSSCGGKWTFKAFTTSGSSDCNNTAFGGDPYPNHAKNCEKLTWLSGFGHGSVGAPFKVVAVENSSTLLKDTVVNSNSGCSTAGYLACNTVFYMGWSDRGIMTGDTYQTLNNTQKCNNSTFGDPAGGYLKWCFFPK